MSRSLAAAFFVVAVIAAAACDQAKSSFAPSPVTPSPAGSTEATTIQGTVNVSPAAQSTGQLAAHAPGTLEVCVVGTDICVGVDASGHFEASGDYSGEVHLLVSGSGHNVEFVIHDVGSGEIITVTVELDGDYETIQIVSRQGGSHSSDDNSSYDGPSDDNPSDGNSSDDHASGGDSGSQS